RRPARCGRLRRRARPRRPRSCRALRYRARQTYSEPLALAIDDGGGAGAAAAAHGFQAVAQVAPLQLVEQVIHEPRPGGPPRVPDGDRAAVDVEFAGVGARLLEPGQRDGGEGFVDLVEVDVLELEPGLLEHGRGAR